MELKRGYEFDIELQVVNPTPEDLGFIAFWESSINQGLIRLGGLKGVGKGRLHVKTHAVLFGRDTAGFSLPGTSEKSSGNCPSEDVLSDLYPRHQLDWKTLKGGYLQKLKTKYDQLGKGE